LSVADKAGVLAKISGIFAKCGMSIVEIAQKGKSEVIANGESRVPLVVITHKTSENKVKSAVAKINATDIADVEAVIRVEE